MSTVPKITIEQAKIICANPANADLWMANQNQMIEAYNKALAEQQESEYITAAQARELGAGNAEWFCFGVWNVCDGSEEYVDKYSDGEKCLYRAIKQSQPEPVDPHAALRAEYIRQRDAVPCELRFYKWEYKGATEIDHPLVWTEGIGESVFKCFTLIIRYTDISCYVSKDGEPAIRILRTEAQELQRKLGDTVEWFDPKNSKPAFKEGFKFSMDGTYTYRTKATIKLDGNMVTPEQAEAEWEAKKESHQLWFKFKDYKWEDVIGYPENMVEYFKDSSSIFELRPKQPTWTGSREDVIALLK